MDKLESNEALNAKYHRAKGVKFWYRIMCKG